jgi:hypothetical protein
MKVECDHKKIELQQVSLVCIETRMATLAVYALQKCMAVANFKECLLLGACPVDLPHSILHRDIGAINSTEAYSDFMIRCLVDYIQGDYVLIIQGDGFIIHPECWNPDFLKVDYIGAVWPDQPEAVAVGNGGFSLRSRRLLEAARNLGPGSTHAEDVYICRRHRTELESRHGIVFASVELARQFSFEEADPGKPTFGFHGIYNVAKVLPESDLKEYAELYTGDILYSPTGRKIAKGLYQKGYHAEARRLLARRLQGPAAIRHDTWMLWVRSLLHQLWHPGRK